MQGSREKGRGSSSYGCHILAERSPGRTIFRLKNARWHVRPAALAAPVPPGQHRPMSTTPIPPAGERLTLLPDPRLTSVAPLLEERLEMTGRHVTAANFASILDSLMRRMLTDAFEDAKAHEGLVWLLEPDGRELTVAWQTGPATRDWRGTRVPAGSGLHG